MTAVTTAKQKWFLEEAAQFCSCKWTIDPTETVSSQGLR